MTSIQIHRFGGPDVLRVVEGPSPAAGPGSVRISVKASGVCFADVLMRMGLYPEAPPLPFIPGYEVAGVVTETGAGVRSVRPGDRVVAVPRFGGYATEVVVQEFQVRPVPARLGDEEAAAMPLGFLTAWIALRDLARVRPGDRVLVCGAAGGVGTAAVQVAAQSGAEVVGLVGAEAKKGIVLSLGAREAFTDAEWKAREPPSGRREFDIILDPRGGAALRDSIGRLAEGGRIVSHGVSSMAPGTRRSIPRVLAALARTPILTPIGLSMRNQGVFGLNLLPLFDSGRGRAMLGRALDGALEALGRGAFRVVIGGRWPLARAGEAHAFLQSRQAVGTLVLV